MIKLTLMKTTPGKEDQGLPLLQRNSLVSPASHCQLMVPQFKLNINCLMETAWIRPSFSNCYEETTPGGEQEEENFLCHMKQRMDIRAVVICTLVCWVQICVFLFQGKSEWMLSACMVPMVKYGGEGVMVSGCCAGDTLGDLFKAHLSILQWYNIQFGLLTGTILCFSTKHTSRLCKAVTERESEVDCFRRVFQLNQDK